MPLPLLRTLVINPIYLQQHLCYVNILFVFPAVCCCVCFCRTPFHLNLVLHFVICFHRQSRNLFKTPWLDTFSLSLSLPFHFGWNFWHLESKSWIVCVYFVYWPFHFVQYRFCICVVFASKTSRTLKNKIQSHWRLASKTPGNGWMKYKNCSKALIFIVFWW